MIQSPLIKAKILRIYILTKDAKSGANKPVGPSSFAKGEFKKFDSSVHQCLKQMAQVHEGVDHLKHQMDNAYEIEKINELESELKYKMSKIQEMLIENQVLKNAIKKANSEIQDVNLDGEYDFRRAQLANEFREVKAEWRETYYSKIDKQKHCIQIHSDAVDHSKKVRKMADLILEYKNLSDKQRKEATLEEGDFVIEKETLDKMGIEVDKANQKRLREEKNYEDTILLQAQKIQDKEYKNKLLELRVREKDKELRLCELKSKEYKKQIRHNTLKPMPKDSGPTLEALISPRYEPFAGAKMRYQQARNYFSPKKKKIVKKNIEKEDEVVPIKPIIEEVVHKNYIRENIEKLKAKKKNMK